MKTSNNIIDLKKALKSGNFVKFSYKKKDGTIRHATGTTNAEFINKNHNFVGGTGPAQYGYTVYWDVDTEGFRCFSDKMFISMVVEG